MSLEIIGAESMGVRSLCCLLTCKDHRIVIDPGVSLGYMRHGLLPHPVQIAEGRRVREKIIGALKDATDVVFSHFHGDHVPLIDANPYQLSIKSLPPGFHELRCWSKSDGDLSPKMNKRFRDLSKLLGSNLKTAEGRSEGRLSFSRAVPHGELNSDLGTVMMTRIEMDSSVFVHASDIQLLDAPTVDRVIDWQPDIVLAAGPPLYLEKLSKTERDSAWDNALRLASNIDTVILDHHLMRSVEGAVWLDELSVAVGKKVYCAADFMGRPRQLLEAQRNKLYEKMPVPAGWHDSYTRGLVNTEEYFDTLRYHGRYGE
jgi:predicted metallo-beta-lactamase superfamily hydrolase